MSLSSERVTANSNQFNKSRNMTDSCEGKKWYHNHKEFRRFDRDPGTEWIPISYMSSSLIPFQFAGIGEWGIVFFCLPKLYFNAAREQMTKGVGVDFHELKGAIIAFKVPHPGDEADLYDEVKMLSAIKTDPTNDHYCQTILQNFRVPHDPQKSRAMTTKAVVGAVSLGDAARSFGLSQELAPEQLVWHVFLQLSEALIFLHYNKTAIVHRDLMPENILLDSSKQDLPGFPNVLLIDFGCAHYERSLFNGEYEADAGYFCRLLQHLRGENGPACESEKKIIYNSQVFGLTNKDPGSCNSLCNHTEGWLEFFTDIHDNVGDLCDYRVDAEYVEYGVEELRERFEEIALRNIRSTPSKVLAQIKERVLDVASEREQKTIQCLKLALES